MNYITHAGDGSINLQATLSASSAMSPPEGVSIPHHPITCTSTLRYDDDGTFGCEHADVPPGDVRTQFCIDHSIALLLIAHCRAL
jgi:hypothetical protein